MSSIGRPPLGALARTARTYLVDLERVLATFAVATGGVLVTADVGSVGHVSSWQGVAAGGVAAAGSLLKGIVARAFGDPNSASLTRGA